jgi:outer membrane protein assembly factor BamB
MTNLEIGEQSIEPATKFSPRLWPGVVASILLLVIAYVVPAVNSEWSIVGLLGGIGCALLVFLWWLFFSRLPWVERLGAVAVIAVAGFVTSRIIHVSISAGAQGLLFPFMAAPTVALALVVSLVASRRLSPAARRGVTFGMILVGCGMWALVRTGGFTAGFAQELHWRWTPTPEELLLAKSGNDPVKLAPPALIAAALSANETPAEWPGFRGPNRDGIIPGVRIEKDWAKSPPVELWRREIGPGWSSFAVQGDRFYTQEQRGEEEVVACYNLKTGDPIWMHADTARFWEPAGGAGPRGTPTLSNGRVFTLGATGIVNALDAANGAVVWSHNAATDTGAKNPGWGFSGSPLVVGDVVVVATSGRMVAYDLAKGELRWKGPTGVGGGYSSPQLFTIDSVPQILLMTSAGAIGVSPIDGSLIWKNESETNARIVQPARIVEGEFLMSSGDEGMGGSGVRRVSIMHTGDEWKTQECWSSRGLKPNFNDLVIHNVHAYGFDGRILSCIDVKDGNRKWKGGRYGNGQLVLLPEQDLLLVLSEDGHLALVSATPYEFIEVANISVLEGKTWNHPVLVGGTLLVRNSEEMAAYRLKMQGR